MPKIQKIRSFSFIIYEESAKTDWKSVLASFFLPCFYILHDKDVKKPHYHVLVIPRNPISENTVKEIVDKVGGANGHFEKVVSTVGYARYLCHKDNPDKHQYDAGEVVSLCGADYISATRTETEQENDKISLYAEIFAFIKEHNFFSYAYFLDYCIENNRTWFALAVSSNGRVIKDYIKSIYWMNTIQ